MVPKLSYYNWRGNKLTFKHLDKSIIFSKIIIFLSLAMVQRKLKFQIRSSASIIMLKTIVFRFLRRWTNYILKGRNPTYIKLLTNLNIFFETVIVLNLGMTLKHCVIIFSTVWIISMKT